MNKILLIICSIAFLSIGATVVSADQPNVEEYVPLFYKILCQEQSPTSEDEDKFFGKDSNDFRMVVESSVDNVSKGTPIWTYLRKHKSLFLPANAVSVSPPSVWVSSPFQVTYLRNSQKRQEFRVIAFVAVHQPEKGDSGIDGQKIVQFILGRNAYLDIGATFFWPGDCQLLYKLAYQEAHPHM